MRDFFGRYIYGILGTVIFHLIFVVIFLLIRVTVTYRQMTDQILVSFEPDRIENRDDTEKEEILPLSPEDQFWHNIAVNRARISNEQFNLEKYADKVREELLNKGAINPENWKNNGELANHEELLAGETQVEISREERAVEESTLAEMENAYRGLTTISYYLPGRNRVYLPLPIYKCANGGKVVMKITVNPYGNVIDTQLDTEQSGSNDHCLVEAAEKAARLSMFNKTANAPERQSGTITYIFQAQ